jgi:phosphohistidine phosphatase SixA
VIVLLVRHARAGKRSKWEGDDRLRPLDEKGFRQAQGLVDVLERYPVDRILSSPYVRCVQTVEPLAQARALRLEEADELAEGEERSDVLRLLGRVEAECPVLCTHGDIVCELLGEEVKKGEVRELELEGDAIRQLRALP